MGTLTVILSAAIILTGALFAGSLFLRISLWIRSPISVILFAVTLTIAGLLGYILWDHYRWPPREHIVAELGVIYRGHTEQNIDTALKAAGFHPFEHVLREERDFSQYGISGSTAPLAKSFIKVRGPVRPNDLFYEYLDAIYLFDGNGNVLTWSYYIDSPSL